NRPDFGRKRPRIADLFDVMDLIAALQSVKCAAQDTITVEIKQSALLVEQEAMVVLRIKFRNLAKELMCCLVVGRFGPAGPLLFELQNLALGEIECVVDGIAQVGVLELALQ